MTDDKTRSSVPPVPRGRKRPLGYRRRSGLEDVLERDLETARIAGLVRAHDGAKGRGGGAGLDVAVGAAGKERVIKRVQRLEAELNVPLSVDAGVLNQRQVHVVEVGLADLREA